jgi:uncharacterized protein (TIGR03083 family)
LTTTTHDLWSAAHAARAALADDLAALTDQQWAAPSLCGAWTVREAVAHLTAAASIGPVRWMWSVLRSGFDVDRHNGARLAEHLGASPAETLARFRRVVPSTTSTFGPVEAWLGEVVVHAEDVRRPLGIAHAQPVDAATAVARFYASRDFTVPGRTLSAGLRLEATDGPFATGAGPLVSGPTLALVMVLAGRPAHLADLTGGGVDELATRLSAP